MTQATLLQNNQNFQNNNGDLTNKKRLSDSEIVEQLNSRNALQLNGEDFFLLGLNGSGPKFLNSNSRGSQEFIAYRKPKEKNENEIMEAGANILATSLLALLPMGALLEQFKSIMEFAHKTQEDNGNRIKFSYTQNIDPKAAINPNESFLPVSPFRIEPPRAPSIWDRVKKEASELKDSKKKKKASKGLGSY